MAVWTTATVSMWLALTGCPLHSDEDPGDFPTRAMATMNIKDFFKAAPVGGGESHGAAEKRKEPLATTTTTKSSSSSEDPHVRKAARTDAADSPADSPADLLDLERSTMSPDWFQAFSSEMTKPYFTKIKQFLSKERTANKTVYPPESDMYSFTGVPLNQIKVVIIGQDPYHGPGQAHGLCFSVRKGVPPPPSLNNIFRELESDLGNDGPHGFRKPKNGDLSEWVKQGVLLLNATLTVRQGEPNSHAKIGWQIFTDAIIAYINRHCPHVVFMLWGGFAQKKCKSIKSKPSTDQRHLVLTATHPSPLGANQGGWFGCKHFTKANAFLERFGIDPVCWNRILGDFQGIDSVDGKENVGDVGFVGRVVAAATATVVTAAVITAAVITDHADEAKDADEDVDADGAKVEADADAKDGDTSVANQLLEKSDPIEKEQGTTETINQG